MDRCTLIGATFALPYLSLAARGTQAQGMTGNVDLSSYPVGPVPPEFLTTWRTGNGAACTWQVVEDASASQGKAIAQVGADPTDHRFPLAV